MEVWALIVFLHIGSPGKELAQRLTWGQCVARGLMELRRQPSPLAVRCERQEIRA